MLYEQPMHLQSFIIMWMFLLHICGIYCLISDVMLVLYLQCFMVMIYIWQNWQCFMVMIYMWHNWYEIFLNAIADNENIKISGIDQAKFLTLHFFLRSASVPIPKGLRPDRWRPLCMSSRTRLLCGWKWQLPAMPNRGGLCSYWGWQMHLWPRQRLHTNSCWHLWLSPTNFQRWQRYMCRYVSPSWTGRD